MKGVGEQLKTTPGSNNFDQLFLDSIRDEDAITDGTIRQAALAHAYENFGYAFRKTMEGLFFERMEQNEDICGTHRSNPWLSQSLGLPVCGMIPRRGGGECLALVDTGSELGVADVDCDNRAPDLRYDVELASMASSKL